MKKIVQVLIQIFCFVLPWMVQSIESVHPNKAKVLLLIIASDEPIYDELQRLWKSYMHLDREHVEAYFIKADPNLQQPYEIRDDVLWTKTDESWIPGILNKTILSFECMLPRIINEFDYVVRTNLSSFYIFPRLLKFLEHLPKNGCYSSVRTQGPDVYFGSGCGFILSPDVVELLVEKKRELFDSVYHADDVVIGDYLHRNQIFIIPSPRMQFRSLDDWQNHQGFFWPGISSDSMIGVRPTIPDEVFHIRVKHDDPNCRIDEDLPVYTELIRLFYGIPL
jgi:hypothetical protein